MALSIGFSIALYSIASKELDYGLRRPEIIYTFQDNNTYNQFRQNSLAQSRSDIVNDLVLLNICVLVVAAILSFYLAHRTLNPIEEALERQTNFASNASHELRTPLTAMKTELEVGLRERTLTKSQTNSLLKSTLEEVIKLENLSNRLLELSRPTSAMQLENVELIEIIDEASKRIKPLIDIKEQKIVLTGNQTLQINTEKSRLTDVLVILLDNASKYGPRKSQITINTASSRHFIKLSVSDQGKGISPTDLPHIFERFYRADPARSKDGASGYGLGLAIAKEITESYGGKIEATSTPRGSTFAVKLPLAV
jgi:signal transduction histidine kinase